MYYHFAILLLFRPLIKLKIIGSNVSPREVCSQAADAIQGLVHSYSQLYTLRRTPSFVPYFVLTSSIMHLAIAASAPPTEGKQEGPVPILKDPSEANLGEKVTRSINQGIEDLAEMAPCHHFAEQALNILRYLAKKWNITVDIDVAHKLHSEKKAEGKTNESGKTVTIGERVEIGHRMKDHTWGTRPMTSSRNFFSPDVQQHDFQSPWGSMTQRAEDIKVGRGNDHGKDEAVPPPVGKSGETMENPLFWPFPMQGRPMLPEGDMLKDAGFEFITSL